MFDFNYFTPTKVVFGRGAEDQVAGLIKEFGGTKILIHYGGGAVYDLGCYCTTMILSMTDSEPEYVMANAEFNDNKVDIFTSALMKLKNGVRAAFTVGMIFPAGTDARKDRLYIHGSKGTITSEVEYNQAGELCYTVNTGGKDLVRKLNAPQNYTLETEQLGRCIENNEEPFVSPDFSVRNAKVLNMILKQIGY